MKNFCLDLKVQAAKIINYEKKEMKPLTKEEDKMHNSKMFAIYATKKN